MHWHHSSKSKPYPTMQLFFFFPFGFHLFIIFTFTPRNSRRCTCCSSHFTYMAKWWFELGSSQSKPNVPAACLECFRAINKCIHEIMQGSKQARHAQAAGRLCISYCDRLAMHKEVPLVGLAKCKMFSRCHHSVLEAILYGQKVPCPSLVKKGSGDVKDLHLCFGETSK